MTKKIDYLEKGSLDDNTLLKLRTLPNDYKL